MLNVFFSRYAPTLADTVAAMIDVDRSRACFQICRVAAQLYTQEYDNGCAIVSGLLVLSHNPTDPIVIAHCVVGDIAQQTFYDFAYQGPQSYGLPHGTPKEFIPEFLQPEKQFSSLPRGVADQLKHGALYGLQWWQSLTEADREQICFACRFAAEGGTVITPAGA